MNLQQLSEVADDQRTPEWEDQFLEALAAAKVQILSLDPQTGPDNWPYLMVSTTLNESVNLEAHPIDAVQRVLAWLAEKGIGMVVNPGKEFPDFILTYGMIWNFRQTGRFIDRRVVAGDRTASYENLAMSGEPTPEYLPAQPRTILREFLRDQGVLAPRFLMLSPDAVQYDLAFSLESLGNPPETEHEGIAEALGWFLPAHYNLVLISEQGLPAFRSI